MGQEDPQFDHFVSDKPWFAFNTIFGTSEEKAFVRMLARHIEGLSEKFKHIYLLRNERHFAIYDFAQGRPFEPDFVLFLEDDNNALTTYQVFVEPKGKFLQKEDQWKKDFLAEIKALYGDRLIKIDARNNYKLIGVPFYNKEDENEFREALYSAIME